MRRSTVRVFIDDYALGRLPEVCVVTGAPTTDRVKFRTNVGGFSPIVILLLFLGPVGWLIALVVSLGPGNHIEGWLPFHHGVARRLRARRWQHFGLGVGSAAVLLVLAWLTESGIFFGLAIGSVVAAMVLVAIDLRREPSIALDASGRWVTLSRVDPRFAAAVNTSANYDLRSFPRL